MSFPSLITRDARKQLVSDLPEADEVLISPNVSAEDGKNPNTMVQEIQGKIDNLDSAWSEKETE